MFYSVEKRKLLTMLNLLVEFTMEYGTQFKVCRLTGDDDQYFIKLWVPDTIKEGTFGFGKLRSIIEQKDFIVVKMEENPGFKLLEIRRNYDNGRNDGR